MPAPGCHVTHRSHAQHRQTEIATIVSVFPANPPPMFARQLTPPDRSFATHASSRA